MTNTHIIKTDAGYGAVNGWPEMRGDEVKLLTAILRGVPRLDGAACVGHPNPDLWFADTNDFPSRLEASRICAGCPVKAACESFAESSNQQHGAWGDIRRTTPTLRDAPPRRPECSKGHRWTDDSTGWRKGPTGGELVRFCRTCQADRQRERRRKAAS